MSVVVTTAVDHNFQHYIPLWAWCINRAYPDYAVKVFLVGDPAAPFLQSAAKRLNLELVEGEFGPKRYEHRPPRFAAWCRYLLFTEKRRHHWEGHDWVYITDADLMVVRQEPPLHVQHIRHMDTIGLCYSNMLRNPLQFADRHLTGLHFCGQEFIRAVTDKCTEYDGLVRVVGGGALDGKPVIYDERLLYQIVRDSGLGFPPHMNGDEAESDPANYRDARFRPWHGLNVGRALSPHWHKTFVRAELPWFREVVREFVEAAQDNDFWRYYAHMTPNARRALDEICRVSGHGLRRKS